LPAWKWRHASVGAKKKPWIVAIGASGKDGLDDIRELVAAFPATLPAVIMVVLHRAWDKPTRLRAVLAAVSRLPVVIAKEDERLEQGKVYIGEPSEHLTLAANTLGKMTGDPEQEHRGRTVDLLFRSVAKHAGARMIGVVLSGSLDDGSRGLEAIHEAGGLSMVLTPAAPPRRGMPANAIDYDGPIDLIGEPVRIAEAIIAACEGKARAGVTASVRRGARRVD
jgi:two-component system, chemotaxis family, protein-glutamate methylesterase/glutaminase